MFSPQVQKPKMDPFFPPVNQDQVAWLRVRSHGPSDRPAPFQSCPVSPLRVRVRVESDVEIIGDQNQKWFDSGTGDLNAEPELELAGLTGGGGQRRGQRPGLRD